MSDDGKPELNERQAMFCEEYVVDLNATAAYIRAGYSQNGASVQASRLLADNRIQERVQQLIQARSHETKITAERVLKEIAFMAYSDISDVMEVAPDGSMVLKDLKKLPPAVRRSIESIKVKPLPTGGYEHQVKLHSKTTSLKLLADHLGLNAPVKHDITVQEYEGKSTADLERELAEAKAAKEDP